MTPWFTFLVIWYTNYPVVNNLEVRQFLSDQAACRFMDDLTKKKNKILNIALYGQSDYLDDSNGYTGLRWEPLECVEDIPRTIIWSVKKRI